MPCGSSRKTSNITLQDSCLRSQTSHRPQSTIRYPQSTIAEGSDGAEITFALLLSLHTSSLLFSGFHFLHFLFLSFSSSPSCPWTDNTDHHGAVIRSSLRPASTGLIRFLINHFVILLNKITPIDWAPTFISILYSIFYIYI